MKKILLGFLVFVSSVLEILGVVAQQQNRLDLSAQYKSNKIVIKAPPETKSSLDLSKINPDGSGLELVVRIASSNVTTATNVGIIITPNTESFPRATLLPRENLWAIIAEIRQNKDNTDQVV